MIWQSRELFVCFLRTKKVHEVPTISVISIFEEARHPELVCQKKVPDTDLRQKEVLYPWRSAYREEVMTRAKQQMDRSVTEARRVVCHTEALKMAIMTFSQY